MSYTPTMEHATTETKPKGRPKFEDRDDVRKLVGVRFSAKEKDQARAAADEAGLSLSEYIRQRTLA